jgi:hypothetical protein
VDVPEPRVAPKGTDDSGAKAQVSPPSLTRTDGRAAVATPPGKEAVSALERISLMAGSRALLIHSSTRSATGRQVSTSAFSSRRGVRGLGWSRPASARISAPTVPHNHEGKEHRKDCPGCKDELDRLLKRVDKSRRNRR